MLLVYKYNLLEPKWNSDGLHIFLGTLPETSKYDIIEGGPNCYYVWKVVPKGN
jgi:hypothetical protein